MRRPGREQVLNSLFRSSAIVLAAISPFALSLPQPDQSLVQFGSENQKIGRLATTAPFTSLGNPYRRVRVGP
jgi:hypothetical protein